MASTSLVLVFLLKGGEITIGSCNCDSQHLCSTMRNGYKDLDLLSWRYHSGFLSRQHGFSQDEEASGMFTSC